MSRILITGARAPAALHLARALAASGHEVHAADTLSQPLTKASRTVARYHRLPPPSEAPEAFADALGDLVASVRPSHVIPTCEEVFYLAWAFETRGFGRTASMGGAPTRLVAPSFDVLARAHDKAAFAADARACGMAPPDTVRLSDRDAVVALAGEASGLVFKPVWSRFAARVLIAPEPGELKELAPSPESPWVAQALISGEELCAYAIAERGQVRALAIYRPTYRAGAGAGIYLLATRDEWIERDVCAYVAATGWSGQIAFDFRRDEVGRPRVLECNPRATSGVHFFGPDDGLGAALLGEGRAQPSVAQPLMIPAAMVLYGLWPAIRGGALGRWMHDFRRARNAMAWPGDRLAVLGEPRAVLELAAIARRGGMSLIEASTSGIAWNGEALPQLSPRAQSQKPFRAAHTMETTA